MSAGLAGVSLPDLSTLRGAIERGRVTCPLTLGALQAAGLGRVADDVLGALGGLERDAVLAVLHAVAAEREQRPPPHIDLVWTGPEPPGASSRDTAVVVRELFREAQRSVLVGGYSFDHGEEILRPLHEAMVERGVRVRLFLDISGRAGAPDEAEAYATARIDEFLARNWPFGPPLPEIYYDPRTVRSDLYASLHAKCVMIDEARTLITSANFTERGQTRNVEVGVLIEDASVARRLVAHWNGLVAVGLMVRYSG